MRESLIGHHKQSISGYEDRPFTFVGKVKDEEPPLKIVRDFVFSHVQVLRKAMIAAELDLLTGTDHLDC